MRLRVESDIQSPCFLTKHSSEEHLELSLSNSLQNFSLLILAGEFVRKFSDFALLPAEDFVHSLVFFGLPRDDSFLLSLEIFICHFSALLKHIFQMKVKTSTDVTCTLLRRLNEDLSAHDASN